MMMIKRYEDELNQLLEQQNDPFISSFILEANTMEYSGGYVYMMGVEMRGYFKGLKVAKEALERAKEGACDDIK